MKWSSWSSGLVVAVFLAGPALSRSGAYEARIAAGESASLVLRGWCADHGRGRLTARRVFGADKTPGPGVRAALKSHYGEPIGYRRVILGCGGVVLSRADNWYLPGRLTTEMNGQLASTDRPFGLVVRSLQFTRRTLSARRRPGSRGPLEVRAVLVTHAGAPFSYVVEDYAPALSGEGGR